MKRLALIIAGAAASTAAVAGPDFGQRVELLAKAQSLALFGTISTLGASSSAQVSAATANTTPTALITLAPGLTAKVVSAAANLGPNIDMMALWPSDTNPTHLITCNEQGTGQVAVQRIEIATGDVQNIISSGMTSCDPAHRTPWGTVIVGEETTTGQVLEILDPLTTTGVTFDKANQTVSDPAHVAIRTALGRLAFEGVVLLPNGVTYYGDENRPGNGVGGGAYFKFVPSTLWAGGAPITDLANSPFASGQIYGLRLGRRSGNTDYGQGNPTGFGVWVPVVNGSPAGVNIQALRASAPLLFLTTYYRPEDMALDLRDLASGMVRMCGNNTGEDGQSFNYGDTFCLMDGTPSTAAAGTSIPEYQELTLGFEDFAMMDNIAYQPGRAINNWIIQEDGEGPVFGRNNDIWSCADDGADKDNLADACAKIATLNDLTAETTGGVFDSTGKRYFVSIQHNITGHGVILEVNGWQ